ncbi:type II toxin-antitoxin system RelE/ParE family toxin [Burkholderia gladioli]|uniref:type II toxin-antitoxin system RelE/ParE family toxin n=1 Tax=Burkholderia gladioli TaxID=28095 RepID=UPI003F55E359
MVDSFFLSHYSPHMAEIITSDVFDRWLRELRDIRARARIEVRIRRLSLGNPGDVKPVGDGVSELRIDHGPGYRVYYMKRGRVVVVLLCGGNKDSQGHDIAVAKAIAAQWKGSTI